MSYVRQCIFLCLLLANVCAWSFSPTSKISYIHKIDNAVQVFLDLKFLIEHETQVQAMVEHVKHLKGMCDSRCMEFPNLTAFLEAARKTLAHGRVDIDDSTFDALYEEFMAFEDCPGFYRQSTKNECGSERVKKEEGSKISTKTALALLKFISARLLSIVPVPLVQEAGNSLSVIAVKELVESHDKSDSALNRETH